MKFKHYLILLPLIAYVIAYLLIVLLQYILLTGHEFPASFDFLVKNKRLFEFALHSNYLYLAFAVLAIWFQDKSTTPKLYTNILKILFICLVIFCIFYLPCISQDTYWNLGLVNGFVHHGLDSYMHTYGEMINLAKPDIIVGDWHNWAMHQGPLWVILVSVTGIFSKSIYVNLFLYKILAVFGLIAILYFFKKIMQFYNFANSRQVLTLGLLAFNPILINSCLAEGHSDLWIALSLVASLHFILQKKYYWSFLPLIAGFWIKVVTALFLFVPLYYLLQEKGIKETLKAIILIILVIASSYLIFIFSTGDFVWDKFSANSGRFLDLLQQTEQINTIQKYNTQLSYFLLEKVFNFNSILKVQIGLTVLIFSFAICLRFASVIHIYVIPFSLYFLIFANWFCPWYLAWFYIFYFLLSNNKYYLSLIVLGSLPFVL